MLDFISTNWIWILLIGGMLFMHLGHGGHGGRGGHGGHGGKDAKDAEDTVTRRSGDPWP